MTDQDQRRSVTNRGRQVETCGQRVIHQWEGPSVESGEMKPYSSSLSGSFERDWHATLDEARAHVKSAKPLRSVRVTFEAYIPVAATEDEISDWIEFELHANGSLRRSNPLSNHCLEARDVDVEIQR